MPPKVEVFTTQSCPWCQKTKEFLTSKGIEFKAFDVAADAQALKRMQEISKGARTVPVIAVGDDVMVGFDQAKLEELLGL